MSRLLKPFWVESEEGVLTYDEGFSIEKARFSTVSSFVEFLESSAAASIEIEGGGMYLGCNLKGRSDLFDFTGPKLVSSSIHRGVSCLLKSFLGEFLCCS